MMRLNRATQFQAQRAVLAEEATASGARYTLPQANKVSVMLTHVPMWYIMLTFLYAVPNANV
jgi:hypothetical protein